MPNRNEYLELQNVLGDDPDKVLGKTLEVHPNNGARPFYLKVERVAQNSRQPGNPAVVGEVVDPDARSGGLRLLEIFTRGAKPPPKIASVCGRTKIKK